LNGFRSGPPDFRFSDLVDLDPAPVRWGPRGGPLAPSWLTAGGDPFCWRGAGGQINNLVGSRRPDHHSGKGIIHNAPRNFKLTLPMGHSQLSPRSGFWPSCLLRTNAWGNFLQCVMGCVFRALGPSTSTEFFPRGGFFLFFFFFQGSRTQLDRWFFGSQMFLVVISGPGWWLGRESPSVFFSPKIRLFGGRSPPLPVFIRGTPYSPRQTIPPPTAPGGKMNSNRPQNCCPRPRSPSVVGSQEMKREQNFPPQPRGPPPPPTRIPQPKKNKQTFFVPEKGGRKPVPRPKSAPPASNGPALGSPTPPLFPRGPPVLKTKTAFFPLFPFPAILFWQEKASNEQPTLPFFLSCPRARAPPRAHMKSPL